MKRVVYSAEGMTYEKKKRLAEDPNTSQQVLAKLANDDDWKVRQSVAKNPNTPSEILAQLANDEKHWVLREVAKNPNTSVEILQQLANDEEDSIRWHVAENPNTPVEDLEKLANDKAYWVRQSVAENPNVTKDILNIINNYDEEDDEEDDSDEYDDSDWPSESDLEGMEDEDIWQNYLSEPEESVNNKLQIYPEPSTQGSRGGMFIYDESGEDNEPVEVDYQTWCDKEYWMAVESNSADEYAEKYEQYIRSLCDWL